MPAAAQQTQQPNARQPRIFTSAKATRKKIPVWVGLAGPSGSGKTMSALRIAQGMVNKTGGKIGLIDTENNRAAHYSKDFDFEHLPFSPPFGSLDYLDAVTHLIAKGCTAIIIDSMSHEHEGIGGMLEQHEEEIDNLISRSKSNPRPSRNEMSMLAWNRPKMNRRHMIQAMLQLDVNIIFCFRAKEKLKISGSKVDKLGWMPIAAEELVYEMTLQALLPPGSKGVPTWSPTGLGEKTTVKLPRQFEKVFARARQFDEEMGLSLATWGSGADALDPSAAANYGTQTERAGVIKALAEFRTRLGWDLDKAKAWRVETFGAADAKEMSMQQLEDARTLFELLSDVGQEAYDAELASLIELGRARGEQAPAVAAAKGPETQRSPAKKASGVQVELADGTVVRQPGDPREIYE